MDIVYIYKAEAGAGLGGMRMSSHVGLRIPMYCTGVGKAILATQSYGEAERVWRKSSIRALTAHTITDFDAFIEQLKRVRMAGYAIDDEENELGIRCVALAVPGMNGRAEAAFSISGLAAQMTDDRIEHLARSEAAFRFASGRVFCCLCFLRAVLHRARFLCYCASRVSTAPGCVITRSPLCISSVSASCAKKT